MHGVARAMGALLTTMEARGGGGGGMMMNTPPLFSFYKAVKKVAEEPRGQISLQ